MHRTILMDNNTRSYHFCSSLFISNLDFSNFQLFAASFVIALHRISEYLRRKNAVTDEHCKTCRGEKDIIS